MQGDQLFLPGDPTPFGAHSADDSGQDPLLAGLNPAQLQAVTSSAPALLIVAGAGSGKTRVLTHRIAHLIRERIAWPSQILAITFTNKAAGEMRERVTQIIGDEGQRMWISTFHSACVRILRAHADKFGYVSGFTIYDTADSRALLKRIIKDMNADSYGFTPANVGGKISRLKNELVDVKTHAARVKESDPRERMFLEIFSSYQAELKRARAFDFDDLLTETVHLFRAFPGIRAIYQRRFRQILVDEYQDTNHAQYQLIRELTQPVSAEQARSLVPPVHASQLDANGQIPPAHLTVVGDSDQSIYAFRGADIRNISEFEQDFPGAERIMLEQNYRSTQTILDAANAVISQNLQRQEKNLWTDHGAGDKIIGYAGYSQHDEARFVADEIEQEHRRGVAYGDIAVFYRTNAQTRALEELLMRAAIPYRVLGGAKFYDRAEIKDALAYLTVIANPYDPIAWSRLLGAPKRGIGPMAEAQLANFADQEGISFVDAMVRAEEQSFGPKVRGEILKLGQMLERLTKLAAGVPAQEPDADPITPPAPVAELLRTVLNETGYLEKLRAKRDPQDEARAENLEEFVAVAAEFDVQQPGAGLVAFLTEVSLVAAVDELDDESGTVSLMTLHTAKGLEFPVVFLTGVEEGILPHKMSLDEIGGIAEERRLMYVGITRAMQRLYVSMAATRAQYDQVLPSAPSRFLQDIPEQLIDWRQSPGEVIGAGPAGNYGLPGGSGSRSGFGGRGAGSDRVGRGALGAGRTDVSAATGSGRATQSAMDAWRERKRQAKERIEKGEGFPNTIVGSVRDNGDLELEVGDRVKHESYGEGSVTAVTGAGAKRVAHVDFAKHGSKKLLVKLAPITKL